MRAWTNVTSPNIGEIESYLNDVAAISTNDVWAVGCFSQNAGDPYYSLVDHWNGTQWVQVPSPNTGRWRSQLNGVAALSASNVWAVGYADSDINYADRTLIEHWDGNAWSVVPSPNTPYSYNELNAIVALAPNDIWAVGYQSSGYGSHTLIMHWNGSGWNIVGSPDAGSGINILRAISALSPNDIWAVGQYSDPGPTYPNGALVLHWNGSQWSVVPTPTECDYYHSLEDVDAIAANDVWAVGNSGPSQAFGAYRTLTMHWDGIQWDIVPSPNVGTSHNGLNGVVAIAPNDVWALGHYYAPNPVADRTQAQHWDGAAWSLVPSADPDGRYNVLSKVSAVSGADVWGVGYTCCSLGALIEHYVDPCPPTPTPTASGTPNTPTPPATFTPRPTCPPLPTAPPPPTPTSNRPPCWAYLTGSSTQCTSPSTYNFRFNFDVGPRAPFGSLILYFEVSTGPGGPWTILDQQTLSNWTVSTTYQGSFIENNIPPQYGWYRVRFYFIGWCIPNQYEIDGQTQATAICGVVTATPTNASATPSATADPTFTPQPVSTQPTSTPYPTSTPTDTPTSVVTATLPADTPTSVVTATLPASQTPCSINFSDVFPSDYFYEAVRYLYCHGVISGYSGNTFRPYNDTTRGQLCKIVVLAEGWAVQCPQAGHFSDVPPGSPFYCFVETAYAHVVISGYADGTFRPGNQVTRAQLCKIIVSAAGWSIDDAGGPHFVDVPRDHPFYSYVETAYHHEIISGYSCGNGCLEFRPYSSATRGQICKIVYQAVAGR